ncbi:MAG: Gx transporter family protein [Clostridia bacterium]|nr:Gx transporter family protein [Clostridia bacterium]
MKGRTEKVALLGMCVALAMLLSYVELLLPPMYPSIPGIKLGLPNVVILFLLYRNGFWPASVVSLCRIGLISLLFGNVMMFLYSLAGGILSLLGMALLKKIDRFSTVGVSVVGGVLHNVGQTLCAIWLLGTAEIGYYLAVLAITGTLSGIFVGLCGGFALKRIARE